MKAMIRNTCLKLTACAALLFSGSAMAQIDYYEDFSNGKGQWSNLDFQVTDVAVCDDGYAFRALPLNDLGTTIPVETVSQSLGISNGETLTLSYNYKLLAPDAIPGRALDNAEWGYFYMEYGPTQNGPWKTIDLVEPIDHNYTNECATRTVRFTPERDTPVYLRLYADAGTELQSGYFIYIDNISALQDNLTVEPVAGYESLKVYPNPVETYLNIEVDNALVSDVMVFNTFGQHVRLPHPDGTFNQLDMSGLADGQYIVHIVADNRVRTVNVMKE